MKRNIIALDRDTQSRTEGDSIEFIKVSSIKDCDSFENKLVFLFSELDQELLSLIRKSRKQPYSSVSILIQMINKCASFTEEVMNVEPESAFLPHLVTIASDKYSHLRLLHVRQNRLSDSTALNLYKGWTGEQSERHEIFKEISLGMTEILNSYLNFFSTSLDDTELSEQWLSICDTFIEDLDSSLKNISF